MIAFIDDHREAYGVEPICRVLPIAPSTYFKRVAQRQDSMRLSARAQQDQVLKCEVARVFAEAAPKLAWLWMCLFGVFYMAARSLWRPLIVSMLILMATSSIMWPLLIFVAPVVWVATAAQAQSLIRARYMRLGWSEIAPYEQDGTTY